MPPPADPLDAEKVELARAEVAEAGALEQTGKLDEALERVGRARAHVEGVRYPAIDGLILYHRSSRAAAARAFERALAAALHAGRFDLAAQAASRQAFVAGYWSGRPEGRYAEAERFMRKATRVREGALSSLHPHVADSVRARLDPDA